MKNKKNITLLLCLVLALLCMFGVYKVFGPKISKGSKAVVIEVLNKESDLKTYKIKTDAEYLVDVMNELQDSQDFSYEGSESDYGLYITSINGQEAVYETDGSYWSIYVNNEYGMYGADQQPVNDGDTYRFAYEKSN